jgi:hypothetical protein
MPVVPTLVPLSQIPAAVVSALDGGAGIVIDLSPAELGRMRIELPDTSGSVSVRLVVEKAATVPLVQEAVETLAQELRQAGIMAQSVTVELLVPDRGDPWRAEVQRAEPGSAQGSAGAGASMTEGRTGTAWADGGAGSSGRSREETGRDGAGSVDLREAPLAAVTERLDLRL